MVLFAFNCGWQYRLLQALGNTVNHGPVLQVAVHEPNCRQHVVTNQAAFAVVLSWHALRRNDFTLGERECTGDLLRLLLQWPGSLGVLRPGR